MTFAVSESSTDQYQRGDGGTGVDVVVGSGVRVAVGVFSTSCNVDVDSTCSMGADVDAAGLAQADKDMTIANNTGMILFTAPLFCILRLM